MTPPAPPNMRPFKTAVSLADMNLSSGWNQNKKAPALHFDDQGRQPNYVRFEEVSFEFYLNMMMMLMTLMRTLLLIEKVPNSISVAQRHVCFEA